jgi:beta-lactamase superfamily II metal-dependent hydrolase
MANPSRIRIRMYNVGFGDCFLIFLPTTEGEKKILIDCGSIKKKKHSMEQITRQVLQDLTDADGVPRVDIMVLSHRHDDHLSAFTRPEWSALEAGEVWMPRIESPDDPHARRIRGEQILAAQVLQRAAAALGLSDLVSGIAANALDGASALDVVHAGFAKRVKPRYLPSGPGRVERVETPLLPGIEIFALGPPRDDEALQDAEPPAEQTLLTGFSADSDGGQLQKFSPFGPDWIVDDPPLEDMVPDAAEVDEAASMISIYDLAAAELDADINNTSLILLFRVGDEYLLFPGDAQWGPWQLALEDDEAKALLEKVTFLKVSHHSSHNGSPASLMRNVLGTRNAHAGKVQAMISVTPRGGWEGIPHTPILTLLDDKQFPYAISDDFQPQPGFTRNADMWVELSIPAA